MNKKKRDFLKNLGEKDMATVLQEYLNGAFIQNMSRITYSFMKQSFCYNSQNPVIDINDLKHFFLKIFDKY